MYEKLHFPWIRTFKECERQKEGKSAKNITFRINQQQYDKYHT